MKTFYQILFNTLVASFTNNFLWFALTFWAYLETESVLATSIIGGSYMLLSAAFGLYFGTLVDHRKKKTAMVQSSLISLATFCLAALLFAVTPSEELLRLNGLPFWALVVLILAGAVAGNLRLIALSTTVTLLVPEALRDKANGMVGTVNGIAFAVTSVFSGLAIGYLGMGWSLVIAVGLTLAALLHLGTIRIVEETPQVTDGMQKKLDIRGALGAVHRVPGLMALIFFTTFNNLLGGVFMSLMDPYGLTLVSVEAWGFIWGFLSIGFIAGGIIVAKRGLGASPLRSLFLANIGMWVVAAMFPVRPSITLLVVGLLVYMMLLPVVEAAEQTIIQKVVPFSEQGRVFGFAQAAESAASPVTAFLIGPIAHFFVIPFMTTGSGATTIGPWFGTGPDRGMALIFMTAGALGLAVTLYAMRTRGYHALSGHYIASDLPQPAPVTVTPKG